MNKRYPAALRVSPESLSVPKSDGRVRSPCAFGRLTWGISPLALITAAMAAALVLTGSASAQSCSPAQIARLLGAGGVGGGRLGEAVTISGDGGTALAGADSDASGIGAAYVFVRSGGVWMQQGSKLVPTGGIGAVQDFGSSVSLSADGNTALIGAFGDASNIGAAYVFVRSGGVWTQQGPRLLPTGGVGSLQFFGYSVSLAGDGNTAIIGASLDGANNLGAAYVFVRSGGVWTQQGPKLVPTGGVGSPQFGTSIFLSSDGTTAIVGAVADNGSSGAAYVFVRSGGVWTQQARMLPTGGVGPGNFGGSVSLSGDGNTAAIGAPRDNNDIGAAYFFVRSGTAWAQQGPKMVATGGAGSFPNFGYSVSLLPSGAVAMVGARNDNNIGAAYIFIRSGGAWTQQGTKLVPSGGAGNFGNSVSLSADGFTAVIGAPSDNNSMGAAYIFVVNSSIIFTQQPVGVTVLSGGTATFTVVAASGTPLMYQWRRNGLNLANGPTGTGAVISGATTPSLTITTAALADNAEAFDCTLANSCGPATSYPAGLGVTPSCTADFNRNGIVNSQDFFDFLNAFFAGCP